MKVGSWVYNILRRWVKKAIKQMGTIMVSVGGTAVLVGITIMLLDPSNRNTGSFIGLVGLALILGGYFKAQADGQKKLERHDELISILKAIATKMGVDVSKIGKGKQP